MKRKSSLRVIVMEGLAMVSKFFIYLQILVLQICRHFIPTLTFSCLPCDISVGEKVFVSGCDCSLPHVYG